KYKLNHKGKATIKPTEINPETAQTIFKNAASIFGDKLKAFEKNNLDVKVEKTNLEIIKPENKHDDWDLKNEKFTMWNRSPEIIKTTKEFTDKVYAYQGWLDVLDCRKEFKGLQWATYKVKANPATINDMYDSIELKNERVYIKTTEWYRGTYPADIHSDGLVTNKEPVFVEIPPMPEHYVEPKTGEVMYHGYEDVEFLLTQMKLNQTNEVWIGFKRNFKEANTQITTKPINI